MKIDTAIKQKKFRSEFEKMVVNILYTASWIELNNTKFFKQFGITHQQYNILRILRGQYPNPATVNLLINRMLDKMSNASRLVDKLILKGMVQRTTCENDRRKVDVLITQQGLDVLKKIEEIPEYKKLFSSTLSSSEAKIINELLDKLRSKEN